MTKWKSFQNFCVTFVGQKLSSSRVFWSAIFLSLFLKVFLACCGHNYDIESWEIVAKLVREGKSVYANTFRFPYGPILQFVLGGLSVLSERIPLSSGRENFHIWVTLFLSLVDIFVGLILRRLFGNLIGTLFLLNPITWLITGFHAQLDQIPILIGLISICFLQKAEKSGKYYLGSILLLGISLITKHTLIFFPLWIIAYLLAGKRRKIGWAIAFALVPFVIFGLSFLPWLGDTASRNGVINNVFHYRSEYLSAFLPELFSLVGLTEWLEMNFMWVPVFSGYKLFWFISISALGFYFRNVNLFEFFFLYLFSLLFLTSSMCDQYLVIPIAACAYYWKSPWVHGYTILSSVYLVFYSPYNVSTTSLLKPMTELLAVIPIGRSVAVVFIGLFLYKKIREDVRCGQE